MKQRMAAERLVEALVHSRIAIYAGQRAESTSVSACRFHRRLQKPPGAMPGSEVVALLAVSRAYRRAAGDR